MFVSKININTFSITIYLVLLDIGLSTAIITQAAARNVTQDLIRRIGINLHHGNQPGIQKDGTW